MIGAAEGFEILEGLVAQADVLNHNVAPLEMESRRLNFERLSKVIGGS